MSPPRPNISELVFNILPNGYQKATFWNFEILSFRYLRNYFAKLLSSPLYPKGVVLCTCLKCPVTLKTPACRAKQTEVWDSWATCSTYEGCTLLLSRNICAKFANVTYELLLLSSRRSQMFLGLLFLFQYAPYRTSLRCTAIIETETVENQAICNRPLQNNLYM